MLPVGMLLATLFAALISTFFFLGPPPAWAIDENDPVALLIRQAGNAEEDSVRLDILRRLQAHSGIGPRLRADADKMVALVDRWQHDKSLWGWYHREIRATADYQFGLEEGSPLEPLASLYRGRMLFWVTNEYGSIIGYHEKRRQFLDRAVEQFRSAAAAFPENRIIRMYLGEPLPCARQYTTTARAPEWAIYQRENLERLSDIVEWWIDNRLRADGEYGGAWDDDCEMWRNWVPVMIAFEHPKITQAQAFFSNALLNQKIMQGGYTSRISDVEHTAEPTTDTILPMMHLAPDDRDWTARAERLAELMKAVWTGRNQRGQLQFKSTYFNADRVDPDPIKACATPYHVRAIAPALLLWQRTGDDRLGALFSTWMDTWVDATARGEHGKPAGVIPAAIHWPDGDCKGPGPNWWDPRHHGEPKLYLWPSAMSELTDALLLTWHMTDNDKYLEPLRSMAALRLAWIKDRPKGPAKPGTPMWCGQKMGFLAGTLAKYRLLTGSDEFDQLLAHDDRAMTIRPSDAARSALVDALRHSALAMRVNFEGFTSEVRFTDRVFSFPRMFRDDMMFAEAITGNSQSPNPALLYATATGNRGQFNVFPLSAVRWRTPPRALAALVTHSGRDRLTAELFHFGPDRRSMAAEFYLLKPGRYTLEIHPLNGGQPAPATTEFTVTGPRAKVAFELPSRQLCRLRVVPIGRLNPSNGSLNMGKRRGKMVPIVARPARPAR